MPGKIEVEFIENFLVVWNPANGSKLYRTGFYGKPLGIPKPKIPEFDVPLILDLMEGLYLREKGIITVFEGSDKRKVSLRKLRQRAQQLYKEFDERYVVYRDLRDSGLIVTPGIKFGCDFAVYKHGPGIEHAPYMVSVKKAKSEITATEIVKTGRLATTVRKRFIIAVPDFERETTRYLIFKWFKA
ncbi:MAG: tRNA-intron lyase [Candidatus Bathyarchaeota archaeon]|nr:tRNA-intron lyase [Candidatus Bathyarchaeota archaeon]MDH5788841.1 tRNA-intron lyase [Candidatus Bathyarchaeota archaeon]